MTARRTRRPKPFIEGPRVYLREVRPADVTDSYLAWMNDPEVVEHLETRYAPVSKRGLEDYVRTMAKDPNTVFFAIVLKRGDKHIGNIKLGPISWPHRRGTIGLMIGEKAHWGQGYASEAIGLVARFARDTLGLHRLEAGSYETNVGSIRAFEKAGFRREADLPERWYQNGRYVGHVWMGLILE